MEINKGDLVQVRTHDCPFDGQSYQPDPQVVGRDYTPSPHEDHLEWFRGRKGKVVGFAEEGAYYPGYGHTVIVELIGDGGTMSGRLGFYTPKEVYQL